MRRDDDGLGSLKQNEVEMQSHLHGVQDQMRFVTDVTVDYTIQAHARLYIGKTRISSRLLFAGPSNRLTP